jgi:sarcosine oxidase
MSPTALVVGAGVTGLATAHALVRRGFSVTVLERGPIPNPIASSFDRHRLIRPHYPDRPVYGRRIREAFDAWDRLWAELGESHYVERGVISVSLEAGDWSDRARDVMDAVGEPYEIVEAADFARRWPQFTIPDMRWCLFTQRGGALLADRILAGYARLLAGAGATLVENAQVERVEPSASRVVCSDGRVFEGDAVVVAAGVGAPALFSGHVATTVQPQRTVLAYAEPPARWREAWATSPAWVDLGSTTEYWGIPPMLDIPLKLGLEATTSIGDPSGPRVLLDEEVRGVFETYRARLKDIDDYRLVEGHTNWWTLAPEERFVFATVDRAHFLSACSGHGFKFGALTGEDVARAVSGEEDPAAVAQRLAARDP